MCIAVPTLPMYLLAHRLPRASCSLPSYFPKPEAAIPPPHQLWELGGRQANRQGAKGVRQAEAGSRRSIEPMYFSLCTKSSLLSIPHPLCQRRSWRCGSAALRTTVGAVCVLRQFAFFSPTPFPWYTCLHFRWSRRKDPGNPHD